MCFQGVLYRDRDGVCRDVPEGRLVRSVRTPLELAGLDAEVERIQPVGLIELLDAGVELVVGSMLTDPSQIALQRSRITT